jgi:methylmalonyl-CoA mutase C-terminal domain/subunit
VKGRILVAKPGLDGHDRGARIVARALRDAGFEVIYTGIRLRPSEIAAIAIEEDVAVIGLSILSGAHITLTQRIIDALHDAGGNDKIVVVGGAIPTTDIPRLRAIGVADIFTTGTSIDDLVARITTLTTTP